MNDGVKILLDRMKTHPEEFVDELSLNGTKWSGLLRYYDDVLTTEEQHAIKAGMVDIKRGAFTKQVMEMLLEEPIQLDPNTYTFNTAGRHAWQSPALIGKNPNEKVIDDALRDAVDKMRIEQLKEAAELYKKELKNKSAFEKVKGKKYP